MQFRYFAKFTTILFLFLSVSVSTQAQMNPIVFEIIDALRNNDSANEETPPPPSPTRIMSATPTPTLVRLVTPEASASPSRIPQASTSGMLTPTPLAFPPKNNMNPIAKEKSQASSQTQEESQSLEPEHILGTLENPTPPPQNQVFAPQTSEEAEDTDYSLPARVLNAAIPPGIHKMLKGMYATNPLTPKQSMIVGFGSLVQLFGGGGLLLSAKKTWFRDKALLIKERGMMLLSPGLVNQESALR